MPSVLAARREAASHSAKRIGRENLSVIPAEYYESRDLVKFVVESLIDVTVALRGPGYCYSQFRDDEIFCKKVGRVGIEPHSAGKPN